jgi:hypothetical protein
MADSTTTKTPLQFGGLYSTQAGKDPATVPKGYYFVDQNGYIVNQYGSHIDQYGNAATSKPVLASSIVPAGTAAQAAAQPAGATTTTGPGVAAPWSAGGATGTQSYLGGAAGAAGGQMADGTSGPIGQRALVMPGGAALSPAQTQQIMNLYTAYEGGDARAGQSLVQWLQGMGMNPGQLNTAVANLRAGTGPNAPVGSQIGATTQPETAALGQMAQIDPASEALRQAVAQSYLTPLQQAAQPNAAQFQSYLDLYKQIDPQGAAMRQAQGQQVADYVKQVTGITPKSPEEALAQYAQLDPQGYAQMQQLGGAMGSYLTTAQRQAALGTALDPETLREITQGTRAGQVARGNVYGTPQLVAEAMTRGQAGMQIQQQRQAALGQAGQAMQSYLTSGATAGAVGNQLYGQRQQQLQSALGLGQGWLTSGATMGDVALNMYNQQQAQLRAAQQGALGYLGSGQTPYQAGASYLTGAEQRAAAAAQGGPQYNPAALGQSYTGTAQQAPEYGLGIGQQTTNWYNSLAAYGGGSAAPQKNRLASAGAGALSGAIGGATAGSAIPGVGTVIGGIAGGVLGGAGGYFS